MKKLEFNYLTKQTEHVNINEFACADPLIEDWYKAKVIEAPEHSTVVVVTELQLLRVRIGVQEGEIAPFLLQIDGVIMTRCDRKGDLAEWPDPICTFDRYLSRKLGW